MICLLNGGYKNHTKLNHYRHSRGVVVTDILGKGELSESMQDYNCEDLEPFTLVGVDWSNELSFYELVWDGSEKLIQYSLYGAFALIFITILSFLFHLKDRQAARFHRSLLARLLIFTAIVFSLTI